MSGSKIKISLNSENQEKSKIIVNDVDVSAYVTGIKFDWQAGQLPKTTIDYIEAVEFYKD